MKYLLTTALMVIGSAAWADGPSAFGCTGLEQDKELPTIEGKGGVFFRINQDLRMNHPFSDEAVGYMAELSRALAENGTTLIYMPIPTKGVVLPQRLPEDAALYGFELDVATWVHADILRRLNAAGVLTIDARAAMMRAPDDDLPFFKADFHWTARGAEEAAKAIADLIRSQPEYDDLPKTRYETDPLKVDVAFSGMRRILQKHCLETLPEAETMTWSTRMTDADEGLDIGLGDTPDEVDGGGALDIGLEESGAKEGESGFDLFGNQVSQLPVALLGTSYSDSPINNFTGFLQQYTELEVVNFAITGGNQFGAMTSYLTSAEFQENRPRFLIWENPIYNNLAQYGDQPMRELIAAARNDCERPLDADLDENGSVLSADLSGLDLNAEDSLFLDSDGSPALEVDFRFYSASGLERTKVVVRGERLRRTGRFYMPLSGLWPEGAARVEIEMTQEFGASPELNVCNPTSEEKS